MNPVNSSSHQISLQRAMKCLASGDSSGALSILDDLDRTIGLLDTSRFLRVQALLILSRRGVGGTVRRLLRRAARDALRIEATDAQGVLRQMRRTLAHALCESAVRFMPPVSFHWIQSSRDLRRLQKCALPLVLLACRLAGDDPDVMACRSLFERIIQRYEALKGLSSRGGDRESMLSE